MKYIVNFSTGLSSFEAARRCIEHKGVENTLIVFSDVRGDPARDTHAAPSGTNWDGEDDDNYRFLADAERLLGVSIIRLGHPEGLGVWGAIFKERAISIGSFVPCTELLKGQILDTFAAQYPDSVRVVGLNWDEDDRIQRSLSYNPRQWFPLTEAPYINNRRIIEYLREHGVEPPRMYAVNYAHGNCGGGCIKAGQAQWAKLLVENRGRYLYNETQEKLFIETINSKASVLRDRRGGETKSLPLWKFRQQLEEEPTLFEATDWGGCGCFAMSPQIRMELNPDAQ